MEIIWGSWEIRVVTSNAKCNWHSYYGKKHKVTYELRFIFYCKLYTVHHALKKITFIIYNDSSKKVNWKKSQNKLPKTLKKTLH